MALADHVPVGVVSIKFVNCHQFRQFNKVSFFLLLNAFFIDFDMSHVEVETKKNERETTMRFPFPLFTGYNSLWVLHRLHYNSGSKLSSNLRSPQCVLCSRLARAAVKIDQRMSHHVLINLTFFEKLCRN